MLLQIVNVQILYTTGIDDSIPRRQRHTHAVQSQNPSNSTSTHHRALKDFDSSNVLKPLIRWNFEFWARLILIKS